MIGPQKAAVRRASRWRAPFGEQSAFSLVEVALALGLFAFVIVPLLGVLGGGLTLGRHAAKDSTLAQIYRQAAAKAAANPYAEYLDPMFFNDASEETASGDANAVYRLTFAPFTPASSDAATGLAARKQWKIEVFSPPGAAESLDKHFIMHSREPVDMKNAYP